MATVIPTRRTLNRVELQRRVRHPLQALRGHIRRYVTFEGLGVATIYLGLLFWFGVMFDWGSFYLFGFDWVRELTLLAQGEGTDVTLRAALLFLIVGGLSALVIWKILWRLTREFNDSSLALVLERRYPRELGDRLITAVELADPKMADKYGYSQELVDQTVNDAADRVEQLPVRQVFNRSRLRWLGAAVAVLTLGLWVLAGATYLVLGMIADWTATPVGYWHRFNAIAVTWTERTLLLQNSYWPRNAYLEVVRFQGSADDPKEWRLGLDLAQKPPIYVRAYQWVLLDRAQGDWRPLRWDDLPELLGRDMPEVAIPRDFRGWIMDLDDLDPTVANGVLPEEWRDKTSGEIREYLDPTAPVRRVVSGLQCTPDAAATMLLASHLRDLASVLVKKDVADLKTLRKDLERGNAVKAVEELLDWQTWTVDKVQLHQKRVRQRMQELTRRAESLVADAEEKPQVQEEADQVAAERDAWQEKAKVVDALDPVFQQLEDLVDSGRMYRRLQKLTIPTQIKGVFFNRDHSKRTTTFGQLREDEYHNKFKLELSQMDESVEFTARAGNFVTEPKFISFLPPPPVTLSADKKEPAYRYYRIEGDQMKLKDLEQTFLDWNVPVDGDETSFAVPLATRLVIYGELGRKMKSVSATQPKGEHKGAKPAREVEQPFNELFAKQTKLKEELAKALKDSSSPDLTDFAADQERLARWAGDYVKSRRLPTKFAKAFEEPQAHLQAAADHLGQGEVSEAQAEQELALTHLRAAAFFRLDLGQMLQVHDFSLVFSDVDGIKGRRRIKIGLYDDVAPRVENVDPDVLLRTLKDKANNKVVVHRKNAPPTTNHLMVTRHAWIPFKGKVSDDIALTDVRWEYSIEPVQVVFTAPGTGGFPTPGVHPSVMFRRALSTWIYTPGGPPFHTAAWHVDAASRAIEEDQKALAKATDDVKAEDGFVPLERFHRNLADSGKPLTLKEIQARLHTTPVAAKFLRDHDLKSEHPGFEFPRFLGPLHPDRPVTGYFLVRISVSARDNNVETSPDGFGNIGRFPKDLSKEPFQFLVVSDNDFLSEIYKEELTHQDKLSNALGKLKAQQRRMSDLGTYLGGADVDLRSVRGRLDLTRKTLSDTAAVARDVKDAYARIVRELDVNQDRSRGQSKQVGQIEEKLIKTEKDIFGPLERLFGADALGNARPFPAADDEVQAFYEAVDRDAELKVPSGNLDTHVASARKCEDRLNRLVIEMEKIVQAMEEQIDWGRVINRAVELLRLQEEVARLAREYHKEIIDKIFGGGK